jgi:hypothetical protein
MARQTSKWLKQMTVWLMLTSSLRKRKNFPFNPINFRNLERKILWRRALAEHMLAVMRSKWMCLNVRKLEVSFDLAGSLLLTVTQYVARNKCNKKFWKELSCLLSLYYLTMLYERPPFWNAWRYGIKIYGIEVIFNGMTSVLSFIKIYQLVQKLLGGTDRQIYIRLWSFTIPNCNCVRTNANSCFSGSGNFIIIFLYFINLWRKLSSLQRYDIAQNYRILHRVVQRLSQHNLKISHHHHI